MASKKKDIQLQTVINNQDEWNEMLKSDGLTVIDVHQAWCGPCKAVLALFKKLRSDLEGDILRFAVAAADNIESLQIFRGKSEPVFLFCAGGKIVSIVRGANAPLLNKTVIAKVEEEKKILEGLMDRSEFGPGHSGYSGTFGYHSEDRQRFQQIV
ncbi:thioredoxin domain-containing protein 3-like isoform X1 [Rhinatrema bivittatum]|uniref:thioredoxin domain-containing protein 3-like isoform X1 n=1 Tax=Rhinatrema bivittatum TaxID=194408 RepID=UPI00112C827A|nr:thioredoxin domain-containing protein 3-like isoform X1 [Rhinatrema bivittatum]